MRILKKLRLEERKMLKPIGETTSDFSSVPETPGLTRDIACRCDLYAYERANKAHVGDPLIYVTLQNAATLRIEV